LWLVWLTGWQLLLLHAGLLCGHVCAPPRAAARVAAVRTVIADGKHRWLLLLLLLLLLRCTRQRQHIARGNCCSVQVLIMHQHLPELFILGVQPHTTLQLQTCNMQLLQQLCQLLQS
jgi:hypothetical protein